MPIMHFPIKAGVTNNKARGLCCWGGPCYTKHVNMNFGCGITLANTIKRKSLSILNVELHH